MNEASGSTPRQGRQAWRWLLPLVAITLLIGALGLWVFHVFSAEIRDEAARSLAGIAEEKRSTIEYWRADADSDARTYFTGTSVTLLLLEDWLAGGRRDEALLNRLRAHVTLDQVEMGTLSTVQGFFPWRNLLIQYSGILGMR